MGAWAHRKAKTMTSNVATYGNIDTNWCGIPMPTTWARCARTSMAAKKAEPEEAAPKKSKKKQNNE